MGFDVLLGLLAGFFVGWAVAARSKSTPEDKAMAIKVLYCVFLALLVVLFVGWAGAAFYPTPQWDSEFPGVAEFESAPQEPSAQMLEMLSPAERSAKLHAYEAENKQWQIGQKKREKLQKELRGKVERHDRNFSLISLLAAVLVMGMGVGLSGRLPVISEGLLLGGLFILIYSIGWSFVRSPKTAVIPVGVGLVVTIAFGYKRFVRAART